MKAWLSSSTLYFLTALVPGLGLVTAIAGLVIWIILYNQFADTATRITEARNGSA